MCPAWHPSTVDGSRRAARYGVKFPGWVARNSDGVWPVTRRNSALKLDLLTKPDSSITSVTESPPCASNSRGAIAVSIDISISFLEGVKEGECLVAEAREISLHRKIAVYDMEIKSGDKLVAKMTGTVYRKSEKIPVD